MLISDMLMELGRRLKEYGNIEIVVDHVSPDSVRLGFEDMNGQVHPMFERIGKKESQSDGMLHPENEYRPAETLIDRSYDKKVKIDKNYTKSKFFG